MAASSRRKSPPSGADARRDSTRADVLTYVYAVVNASRAPRLGAELARLPECESPRALDAGDGYFVVVASAPRERYGADALETLVADAEAVTTCAMRHGEVIDALARAGTVVPMKLFTLFASDARALGHVRRMGKRLARIVARVDGCREWGVRALLGADAPSAAPRSSERASGTAFLRAKRDRLDEASQRSERARRASGEVFERLAACAREARRRDSDPNVARGRLVLDAVFLVPTTSERTFRTTLRRAAQTWAERGDELVLTGPWAPYHFVQEPA